LRDVESKPLNEDNFQDWPEYNEQE
jgi:hypothetical protein